VLEHQISKFHEPKSCQGENLLVEEPNEKANDHVYDDSNGIWRFCKVMAVLS
jgi:hypothetical protein